MPGVPPDTVSHVKKGIRGLFSRRKSKEPKPQPSQPVPTSTSQDGPTATSNVAAAAPVTAASATQGPTTRDSPLPPPPQSASSNLNKAPQLSAPSQVEEANAIDLNPSASDAVNQPLKQGTEPSTAMPEPLTEATEEPSTGMLQPAPNADTELPPIKPIESATGMSATSGPLGDHMAEVYVDDDVEDVGPKGETLEESRKDETGVEP